MKIYVSKEFGSIYHIFDGELAFTPLSNHSDIYELDGDKPLKGCFLHGETGLVEWDRIDEDIIEPLRAIEKKLKEQDKIEQCQKCGEQVSEYIEENGICESCNGMK